MPDINIDTTAPSVKAVSTPAPNPNGWNNSPVTVTFVATDALSGVANVTAPVVVKTDGAGQVVAGSATDKAGNVGAGQTVVNLDTKAPEGYFQFDPATDDVAFLGRDTLSGVTPGAIPPVSVSSVRHGHDDDDWDRDDDDGSNSVQLRTYKALDFAGNSITVVAKVRKNEHRLAMSVVSVQYGAGPVMTLASNSGRFDWDIDGGKLSELDQTFEVGRGEEAPRVEADFDLRRNQTTIEQTEPEPRKRLVKSGLVFLRLATLAGALSIEY